MINFYPANKMENLVLLLNKVLALPKANILEQDVILVQSKGMQHWLNMAIATESGISMNMHYQMPAQFFWQMLRQILGPSAVPESAIFTREVMCWKIYQALAEPSFRDDESAREATNYWYINGQANAVKQFQLAYQLADLFEQYLIYRIDWIENWQLGNTPHWQAKLWQTITHESPINVNSLIEDAINKLPTTDNLPSRILVFGINSLPPSILNFFDQISRYTQVHLFHLNPCEQYWGDLVSEKQRGAQMLRWLSSSNDYDETANPLLANLGQQGREFLRLIPDLDTNEIPVFELSSTPNTNARLSVLQQVQRDILNLENPKLAPKSERDDSITFSSSHNKLREIQGLHDWLLHQFNQDNSLTPKDILVMCPQVEDYAPYIDAVFSRSWETDNENAPPLPCSIADRQMKNSTPMIDAFEQLLMLPDSRFQLNAIISYLRLPAVQSKLKISSDDLLVILPWLEESAIHWGIDSSHKAETIRTAKASSQYTWHQGLSRLLQGFALSDKLALINDDLALPLVEGDQGQLLGSLCLLLEKLKIHASELKLDKTPVGWQAYLHSLKTDLFSENVEDQQAWLTLTAAIDAFAEYCDQAQFEQTLPLSVVRRYFSDHFASADTSQQFLTGQVTFCSMIPMRSIPFKVIAILGLNDGDYPRQNQHFEFDLIAKGESRIGDRSRRGDDRYLFLEAILSCREKFYLSYQGRDIKNNTEREPSPILREIMDYLEEGYGWEFSGDISCVKQLPLQAFSELNYIGDLPSFNANWLKMITRKQESSAPVRAEIDEAYHLTLDDLTRCFSNPCRLFANQTLHLYLDDGETLIADAEPFVVSTLDKYLTQQELVHAALNQSDIELIIKKSLISGRLPDNAITPEVLNLWREESNIFSQALIELGASELNHYHTTYCSDKDTLSALLPVLPDGTLIYFRQAKPKGRDLLQLWILHLLNHVCHNANNKSIGVFFDDKKQEPLVIEFPVFEDSEVECELTKLIDEFKKAQVAPDAATIELGHALYFSTDRKGQQKPFGAKEFKNYWENQQVFSSPINDPYCQYFYPETPQWQRIQPLVVNRYFAMYKHLNPLLLPTLESEV